MRVETYPNGEGKVLHLWHDEISILNEKEIEEVAKEFIEVSNFQVLTTLFQSTSFTNFTCKRPVI